MLALEANLAFAGQSGERLLQPRWGFGAVGIFLRILEVGEVDGVHTLTVEVHGDDGAGDEDHHLVPLTGLLHRLFEGALTTEDRSTLPAAWLARPFLREVVGELDLNGIGHPFLGVAGMHEDSAVGAFAVLELKLEHEVRVVLLGPDDLILGGDKHTVFIDGPDPFVEGGVGEIILEERFEFLGLSQGGEKCG